MKGRRRVRYVYGRKACEDAPLFFLLVGFGVTLGALAFLL